MPAAQQRRLSALLGAVVLGAVLPHVLGHGYTVAALAALPVVMAASAAMNLKGAGLMTAALLAAFTLPVLPDSMALPWWLLAPVGLWLALNAAYLPLAGKLRGLKTPLWWLGSCALTALCAAVTAFIRFPAGITEGLADAMCALVDQLPLLQKPRVLFTAYQMGLARLSSSDARELEVLIKVAGVLGVTQEVQHQLLLSLHLTLERLFFTGLPEVMVVWLVLTGALATLVKETLLRRGGDGELPRFAAWHLPRGTGAGMGVMMLLGALQLFTANPALVLTSLMCWTLGYWIFLIQGAAAYVSVMYEPDRSPLHYIGVILLTALLLPFVLVITGIFDQLTDFRRLRGDAEDQNNEE